MNLRVLAEAVLVGLFLNLAACQQAPTDAHAAAPDVKAPTEVLKDFEMNDVQNSTKTMTLQSIEARIYESQNYADVDKPFVLFYKLGKISSRLNAPEGRLQTDTHAVEAWGGVTVISTDSTTLTTERLHYDPKTQKITSTDTVHLDKPDSITDGIGLVTDPDLKSVKIGRQRVRFKKGMQE